MSHGDVKVILYACDVNIARVANLLANMLCDMDFAEKGRAVHEAVECMMKGTCSAWTAYQRVFENAVHRGILFASSCSILETAFAIDESQVYGDIGVLFLVIGMLRWEVSLLRRGARLVLYSRTHPIRMLREYPYAKLWALYSGTYAASLVKAAEIAARYAGLKPKPLESGSVRQEQNRGSARSSVSY